MSDEPSIGYWSALAKKVPRGNQGASYNDSLGLSKPWLSMIDAGDFWEVPPNQSDVLRWEPCDVDGPIPFKVTPAGRAVLADG